MSQGPGNLPLLDYAINIGVAIVGASVRFAREWQTNYTIWDRKRIMLDAFINVFGPAIATLVPAWRGRCRSAQRQHFVRRILHVVTGRHRFAHRDALDVILERYQAANPRLFGSVARGDATGWLRAFNDIRLALATRLGVEEDDEDYWLALPDDDPRAQAHDIYEWVGYLQETVIEALTS